MDPLYDSLAASLWPWLRVGFRWGIEGDDEIPRDGPALLVFNHISHLDALVAGYVAFGRRRRARFLATDELFPPPFGAAVRALGQIPAFRRAGAALDLPTAARALEDGDCVVAFPEETISHETFEPLAFRTAVADLMQRTGVAAIPVGIWGPHRVFTKGRRPAPRLGVEVQVRVGEAVPVRQGEAPAATATRLRQAVVRCVRRAQEAYSQRPAPGEDDWWVARPPVHGAREIRASRVRAVGP